jgi:hypothetical protein
MVEQITERRHAMHTQPLTAAFEWTITMATRGYHVRHNDQVVRHFYDLETCHRFIKNAKAAS